MSKYHYSNERKQRQIRFLREYIELCLKHNILVLGIIGAETAMDTPPNDIKSELRMHVGEMIHNEYDDSGNIPISDEDEIYLYSAIKDLIE